MGNNRHFPAARWQDKNVKSKPFGSWGSTGQVVNGFPGRWPFWIVVLGANSLCPWPELPLRSCLFLLNASEMVGKGLKAAAIVLPTSHLVHVLGRGRRRWAAIATVLQVGAHPPPRPTSCPGPPPARAHPAPGL